MKWLCKFYLWAMGWKTGSTLPVSVKKCVLVAAPHTSNMDYPIALSTLYAAGVRVRFLAKKQLFKFPLSILMRLTGGLPVDRSRHTNMVDAMIEMFSKNERLVLMIPVEGTRSYVKEWKSGFYHTAVGAGVPIALGYLDYGKKLLASVSSSIPREITSATSLTFRTIIGSSRRVTQKNRV